MLVYDSLLGRELSYCSTSIVVGGRGRKKKAWIEINWKARKLLENLDGINDLLIIMED
jgi:hypothetical protein